MNRHGKGGKGGNGIFDFLGIGGKGKGGKGKGGKGKGGKGKGGNGLGDLSSLIGKNILTKLRLFILQLTFKSYFRLKTKIIFC